MKINKDVHVTSATLTPGWEWLPVGETVNSTDLILQPYGFEECRFSFVSDRPFVYARKIKPYPKPSQAYLDKWAVEIAEAAPRRFVAEDLIPAHFGDGSGPINESERPWRPTFSSTRNEPPRWILRERRIKELSFVNVSVTHAKVREVGGGRVYLAEFMPANVRLTYSAIDSFQWIHYCGLVAKYELLDGQSLTTLIKE